MTRKFIAAVIVAAAVVLVGCAPLPDGRELVVGASADAESALLAELYAGALRYYGAPVRVEEVADPIAALEDGEANVAVGFTGRVLQRFQPGAESVQQKSVYRAMVAALPEGLAAGDYAIAAEDKPTAVVTESTAVAWGGRELTALVRHCDELQLGAAAEVALPESVGGCVLPPLRLFAGEAALFDALRSGRINAAWATSADPDVPADVVVLADRRPPLVQAENVVPLYRRDQLNELEVRALNEVAGEFNTTALAEMRQAVADGADPRQVVEDWLGAHPLGRS